MKMTVDLKKHSYPIYIERGILKEAAERIAEVYQGSKIMIISDDRVYSYYGEALKKNLSEKYECAETVIPHGEPSKAFETLPGVYSSLLEAKISRTDLIVALGGGVVGDLAGFVAATFLRGIKFVQIPTSILAQVDSSVGGKVAVDLPQGKNLVGAFYQPKMVLIDPDVLETCQLSMGLTELAPGNLWNTMPCHTHERRMEVYFYFNMDDDACVFHMMGQPQETRHIVMHNEQAVISPSWSIHSGVGTKAYTFIWGMVGENQVFDDMDHVAVKDLR